MATDVWRSSDETGLWALVRRVIHWGPLVALLIIKWVFFTCIYLTSWWLPPYESVGGTVNHALYMASVGLIMYNFLCSVGNGGGYVPLEWKPEKEEDSHFLQFCGICNGFKSPRAHHCRKCNRCVLKMDHHCPWINNCVGHRNHRNFSYFLLYCVLGSMHSLVLLVIGLNKAYNLRYYEEREEHIAYELSLHGVAYPPPGHTPPALIYLSLWGLASVVLSIGLSLGVVIALGSLLYFQMKSILLNESAIESWIGMKAVMRLEDNNQDPSSWHHPYDLGRKNNFKAVFCWPDGDGVVWPVREGCNQYTLTAEQKQQKEDKRLRQRTYVTVHPYSGRYFPWCSQGFCACIRTPINDEPRLKLVNGNKVNVTRWKKYWLYGELVVPSANPLDPPKGWFPRRCAVSCHYSEFKKQN